MIDPKVFTAKKTHPNRHSFQRASMVIERDDLNLETREIKIQKLLQVQRTVKEHDSTPTVTLHLNSFMFSYGNPTIMSSDKVWKDVAICLYSHTLFYRTQSVFFKSTSSAKWEEKKERPQTSQPYTIEHIFDLENKFKILVKKDSDPDEFFVFDPEDITPRGDLPTVVI